MTRFSPDMSGKASEIDDANKLYARIGYRVFLAYRDGLDRLKSSRGR
jgi:hypothetical protein